MKFRTLPAVDLDRTERLEQLARIGAGNVAQGALDGENYQRGVRAWVLTDSGADGAVYLHETGLWFSHVAGGLDGQLALSDAYDPTGALSARTREEWTRRTALAHRALARLTTEKATDPVLGGEGTQEIDRILSFVPIKRGPFELEEIPLGDVGAGVWGNKSDGTPGRNQRWVIADHFELREEGAPRAWMTNFPTAAAAWAALDGFAPRALELKVRRIATGEVVPRVDYLTPPAAPPSSLAQRLLDLITTTGPKVLRDALATLGLPELDELGTAAFSSLVTSRRVAPVVDTDPIAWGLPRPRTAPAEVWTFMDQTSAIVKALVLTTACTDSPAASMSHKGLRVADSCLLEIGAFRLHAERANALEHRLLGVATTQATALAHQDHATIADTVATYLAAARLLLLWEISPPGDRCHESDVLHDVRELCQLARHGAARAGLERQARRQGAAWAERVANLGARPCGTWKSLGNAAAHEALSARVGRASPVADTGVYCTHTGLIAVRGIEPAYDFQRRRVAAHAALRSERVGLHPIDGVHLVLIDGVAVPYGGQDPNEKVAMEPTALLARAVHRGAAARWAELVGDGETSPS